MSVYVCDARGNDSQWVALATRRKRRRRVSFHLFSWKFNKRAWPETNFLRRHCRWSLTRVWWAGGNHPATIMNVLEWKHNTVGRLRNRTIIDPIFFTYLNIFFVKLCIIHFAFVYSKLSAWNVFNDQRCVHWFVLGTIFNLKLKNNMGTNVKLNLPCN